MLSTLRFWGSDFIPESLIEYILSCSNDEKSNAFSEFGEELCYLSVLVNISTPMLIEDGYVEALDCAMEDGYVDIVRYLFARRRVWTKHSAGYAAAGGHFKNVCNLLLKTATLPPWTLNEQCLIRSLVTMRRKVDIWNV